MRTLYLVTENYPNPGGDSIFLTPELEELKKRFKIVVICASARSENAVLDEEVQYFFFQMDLSVRKKIKYVMLYLMKKSGWKEIKEILGDRAGLCKGRLLKSIEFFACGEEFYTFFRRQVYPRSNSDKTVFFTYWNRYYSLPLVLRKKKYKNFLLITRLHGCDLFQERYAYGRQPFKNQMNEMLDRLYFAACLPKEYYRKEFPDMPEDKMEVKRLGVYPICGKETKMADRPFLLVSCANVIPLKRVELIAEALLLIDSPICWIHFGGGSSLEHVRQISAEVLQTKKNISIKLPGNVGNGEIRRFYQENYVDCFITTSSTEGGSPVSVMEAMAAGVPVIGTPVGDVSIMIDGNGILLNEDPSRESVAAAIENMIHKKPEKMRRMRERSYRLWEEKFNAVTNAEAFAESVETLVESPVEFGII